MIAQRPVPHRNESSPTLVENSRKTEIKLPIASYSKWKLEFLPNILWAIVPGNIFSTLIRARPLQT